MHVSTGRCKLSENRWQEWWSFSKWDGKEGQTAVAHKETLKSNANIE